MPLRSSKTTRTLLALGLAGVSLQVAAQTPAPAQPQRGQDWPMVKCERYKKATAEALTRQGRKGLSDGFITRHEAFLASNCEGERDVCPRSAEELALANTLVIVSMNLGMASTFAPFACRK